MAKCECGTCGLEVSGEGQFRPGHDQILRTLLEQKAGGLLCLRTLVNSARDYSEGTVTEEKFAQIVRDIFARKLSS